jgi:hypothetical protein
VGEIIHELDVCDRTVGAVTSEKTERYFIDVAVAPECVSVMCARQYETQFNSAHTEMRMILGK